MNERIMEVSQHCKIAGNIGDTDIFDENSPIMFDDKIDASPYISYVWKCPKCNAWTLSVHADKKENVVFCMGCRAKYDKDKFKFMHLDLVNAITQNPHRIDLQKFKGHGNPKGSIEAYPMIFFSWNCPSCDHYSFSIPRHDGKLFGCPKCGLRYRYNAIRYEDVDLVERYVNAGIKLFQI